MTTNQDCDKIAHDTNFNHLLCVSTAEMSRPLTKMIYCGETLKLNPNVEEALQEETSDIVIYRN